MEATSIAFSVVKTNKSGLNNTNVNNGSIYFVEDTKELYFDYGSKRTAIKDIEILETDAERSSILFTPLNKFYFTLDTNRLYLYKDGSWHSITQDLSDYYTTSEVDEKVASAAGSKVILRTWE